MTQCAKDTEQSHMFVLDNDIYCTVGYISSIVLRYVEQLEVAGKPQLYGYDLKLITTLCVTGTCLVGFSLQH